MNKTINVNDFLEEYKQDYASPEQETNESVLQDIQQDYISLIDLRNRIEYDIKDKNVYAEDTIVLDHTLDLIETFLKFVDKGKK